MDLLSNRHRIGRWLRGLWAEDAEATPDRLALRHVAVSDRQVDVATFGAPEKAPEDIEDLLGRIEEALENDADGLGGVQKYVLLALREGRPLSRLPLRVAPAHDDGGGLEPLESEPANARGLLGQLMRHNEVQSRMFAMSMGQVVATMQRTIARLQETVEVADERRLSAVDVAEEMLSRSHERQALTQMVEDNRAAKTTVIETVKAAMPFLMQHLKKASGADGWAPTRAADLVAKLAASLQAEQLLTLEKVLTAEQMALVQELLTHAGPTEEAEDEPAERSAGE